MMMMMGVMTVKVLGVCCNKLDACSCADYEEYCDNGEDGYWRARMARNMRTINENEY